MSDKAIPHDRAFWRNHYGKWRRSQLSKAEFGRKAGLSITRFYYWCRVFEHEEQVGSKPKPPGAFVPLSLAAELPPAFSLTLGDVTLRCDQAVSGPQLRDWLVAIRSSL